MKKCDRFTKFDSITVVVAEYRFMDTLEDDLRMYRPCGMNDEKEIG